ncbi:hypothetical protein ACFE6N_14735 [Pedobacter sp. BG31]|uniref:hypothetical protein n=1 Tax=Pedobacter sp. BG31 TaxID=3349697 RepID=UPI0035F4B283
MLTTILFFTSCKKTQPDSDAVIWNARKIAIQNKVKTDIANLKVLLPYTISRAVNGNISLDNQKINEYFSINSSSLNKVSTVIKPKNTNDIIANIKAKQLSSTTPIVGEPGDPVDEEDPYEVLTSVGYRNNYRIATENYTDLNSYIFTLNAISQDIINTALLTVDEKVMMYTEIEFLKQFATDLETNPDYWITMYAPIEYRNQTSFIKNSSLMSIGNIDLTGKTIMAGAKPNQGCKIDTRSVLIGGVVSGFWAAVGAAKVGALAGTVTVPGIGTVTGAVSGFMAGFASGFTVGVVTGVVGSLLYTCGR